MAGSTGATSTISFNDVLYHLGQTSVTEDDALEIQGEEPWVTATVADIPNSYGG